MGKSSSKEILMIVEEMQEWVDDESNYEFMYKEPVKEIEIFLKSYTKENISKIASLLNDMATWIGTCGSLEVLKSDENGWKKLNVSLIYKEYYLKILLEQYDQDERRHRPARVLVNEGALCLAHALAMGEFSIAKWCGKRLIMSLNDGSFGYWSHTHFEPFIVKLFAKYENVNVNFEGNDQISLGHYEDILKYWDDEESLALSMNNACDYHLSRIDDPTDEDFPEFEDYPYNIFPVDILAIFRVREYLNLNTPQIDHPLMSTPLANVPEKIIFEKDLLLEKIGHII